jgi:hypothetical protein
MNQSNLPLLLQGCSTTLSSWLSFEDELFLLVERGSFCQLLCYCQPALSDKDIPKYKTVQSEIIRQAHLAEEKIHQKFAICVHLIYLHLAADLHAIGSSRQSVLYLRHVDFKTRGPIHFCHCTLADTLNCYKVRKTVSAIIWALRHVVTISNPSLKLAGLHVMVQLLMAWHCMSLQSFVDDLDVDMPWSAQDQHILWVSCCG